MPPGGYYVEKIEDFVFFCSVLLHDTLPKDAICKVCTKKMDDWPYYLPIPIKTIAGSDGKFAILKEIESMALHHPPR